MLAKRRAAFKAPSAADIDTVAVDRKAFRYRRGSTSTAEKQPSDLLSQ